MRWRRSKHCWRDQKWNTCAGVWVQLCSIINVFRRARTTAAAGGFPLHSWVHCHRRSAALPSDPVWSSLLLLAMNSFAVIVGFTPDWTRIRRTWLVWSRSALCSTNIFLCGLRLLSFSLTEGAVLVLQSCGLIRTPNGPSGILPPCFHFARSSGT